MRPAGLAEVEAAKADGRWEAAYAGQRTAKVPDDLQRELDRNKAAARVLRHARQRQPLRDPLPAAGGEEAGDARAAAAEVRRDAGAGREDPRLIEPHTNVGGGGGVFFFFFFFLGGGGGGGGGVFFFFLKKKSIEAGRRSRLNPVRGKGYRLNFGGRLERRVNAENYVSGRPAGNPGTSGLFSTLEVAALPSATRCKSPASTRPSTVQPRWPAGRPRRDSRSADRASGSDLPWLPAAWPVRSPGPPSTRVGCRTTAARERPGDPSSKNLHGLVAPRAGIEFVVRRAASTWPAGAVRAT